MKRDLGMVAAQWLKSKEIEMHLAKHQGTSDAPEVFVNPYGIAPLSALVCFETAQNERFQVTLKDTENRPYLSYETPAETAHRIIVPGIINGAVCTFEAKGSAGTEVHLALPKVQVEAPLALTLAGTAPENTLLFATQADGAGQPCAFNAQGDLVWTLTLPLNHRLTMLENGHFLCGAPLQLAPPYSGTALWEMDALGHIYREIRFEDGFVGDFAVLANGNIVAITQNAYRGTARDTLVWLDGKSGKERMRLRAADYLQNFGGSAGQNGGDWFQGASLRYDHATGLLYWSSLAHNVVMEIDAATAEVVRIIGHTDGWDETRTKVALFKRPVIEGTFEEAYGVTRWGDDLYYINANRYPLGKKLAPTPYNINRLNLKTGRVSMFLPNEENLVSPVFCDLKLLKDGSALVLAGGISDSTSKLPGIFLWEKQEDVALSAQAMLYKDGGRQARWQFDDNLSCVTLWQPAAVANWQSAGTVLGGWVPCFEMDVPLPYTSEHTLDGDMYLEFWQDDARLSLSGTFYQGEVCTLILRRGDESHRFYLNTTRMPFATEWLYTYNDDIDRPIVWAIPIAHLPGEWQLDIQIDDTLYHTNEIVYVD